MTGDDDAGRRRGPSRRAVAAGLPLAMGLPALGGARAEERAGQAAPAGPAPAFSFETVVAQAERLAGEAHEARPLPLVGPFADLDYDSYRAIRFREERRAWRGEARGFEIDFLPPGLFYQERVDIALVVDGRATPVPFDPGAFHYHPSYFPDPEGAPPPDAPRGLSYSGLRVRAPINSPEVMDEVAVFQGASYFRAVGRDQLYGLSARGLAIGTAAPEGEEFPHFRAFWIHRPEPEAGAIRIQALLDSPSVTGAYDFLIAPGAETVMTLACVLFPRRDIPTVGIAPLTSMYYFSPAERRGIDDYREAVHDSSGLQMVAGSGERLWRPLANPKTVQVSAFADANPRGFALSQRRRAFADYEDAEARYEKRPSGWIAPRGDWGEGSVMLVELPTDSEFNDNVVAFWRPNRPLEAGSRHRFDYRIHWGERPPDETPLARIRSTRGGRAVNAPDRRTFVVDFDGPPTGPGPLVPKASASAGTVVHVTLAPVDENRRLRAAIEFDPGEATLAELRLALMGPDGARASEIWLYRWLSG